MDSNLVRLVLIALGVVLVVGIYLWDRYKRAAPRVRRVKRVPAAMSIDPDGLRDESLALTESGMEDAVESVPEMRVDDETEAAANTKPVRRAKPVLDPDPTDLGEWSTAQGDAEPQFSMDLRFDAHGESNYLHADPALADDVERKIIVINLKAVDGVLAGSAIERACREVGLVHGEMSIYHRHDGSSDRVLFSMASMVEPGPSRSMKWRHSPPRGCRCSPSCPVCATASRSTMTCWPSVAAWPPCCTPNCRTSVITS